MLRVKQIQRGLAKNNLLLEWVIIQGGQFKNLCQWIQTIGTVTCLGWGLFEGGAILRFTVSKNQR